MAVDEVVARKRKIRWWPVLVLARETTMVTMTMTMKSHMSSLAMGPSYSAYVLSKFPPSSSKKRER
jgi:hypothetical protein